MKLFELDATRQTNQAAKVFESYFGNSINFNSLTRKQARHMLTRVRSLIKEHRSQPSFHTSEQNPNYIKLIVLEQGLASKIKEEITATPAVGAASAAPTPGDMQKQQAAMTLQRQQKQRQLQDEITELKKQQVAINQQISAKQKEMATPMGESRRRISESEVEQAQVVLASQDMVDQVQKMIEQVTSMQFKDLPALVDQVKNQMGPDQAMQFNQDVTTALTSLTQNLQGSKTQLEGALGVVTGQTPTIPGQEPAPAGEVGLDAELPPSPEGEEEIDIDSEEEVEEPTRGPSVNDLGRGRR